VRFALTDEVLEEARRFRLRSACCHCAFERGDGRCSLGWPNQEQRRWPLDAPDEEGRPPVEVAFCKEFELR
jgi:hypothetical protein